ncbi:MAG: ComF family protein [Acutalibacteraceae bacterium]
MIKIFLNFFKSLCNFMFPGRCALCEDIVSEDKLICSSCDKILTFEFSRKQIGIVNNKKINCIAPFTYSGKIRDAIIRFKFCGKVGNCKFFSSTMVKAFKNYPEKVDFIVPVPISLKRKMQRKYNQCEILTEEISKILDIPYQNVLLKIVDNPAQHDIASVYKSENVKNVYKVNTNFEIKGKKILLIDDVCTTGNTLRECSKTLLSSGAESVLCLVIAFAK